MGIFGRSKKNKPTLPPQPETEYGPNTSYSTAWRPQTPQNLGSESGRPQTSQGLRYAPPPPGWIYPAPQPYQQVFVSNYILAAPQPLENRPAGKKNKNKPKAASVTDLSKLLLQGDVPSCIPGAKIFNEGLPVPPYVPGAGIFNEGFLLPSYVPSAQRFNEALQVRGHEGAEIDTLYKLISSKLDAVVTLIDGEKFSGDEKDLWVSHPPTRQNPERHRGAAGEDNFKGRQRLKHTDDTSCPIATAIVKTNYFAKVNIYANSRLPPDLPPVKLYIPTFPLLCTAARYSEQVYDKPSDKEREAHVDGDWRLGTKAMVIKSVPMDDMDVIVFAIRGTQTFLDWSVNLNSTPSSPVGYLDDPGNLCHSGFLSVARKMVKPVAARLRHLLEEDPRRSSCSLLITGHSAGGAVAALIYSHMLATTPGTSSELNVLTGCFKRVHCVTFGAPPVSLLPLSKPADPALGKSLFLSFVNEGDPVARAEKAYVRSLLELYVQPTPNTGGVHPRAQKSGAHPARNKAASASNLSLHKSRLTNKKSNPENIVSAPRWPVPPATLSNAGRLVLLRSVPRPGHHKRGKISRIDDGVQARGITDELLRGVVWGDPVCHMMRLYARRIEALATNAVVGRA